MDEAALIEELARALCVATDDDPDRWWPDEVKAAALLLPIIRRIHNDAIEKAANVCGSLAETVYDDADGFQAATGCEAAIRNLRITDQKEPMK